MNYDASHQPTEPEENSIHECSIMVNEDSGVVLDDQLLESVDYTLKPILLKDCGSPNGKQYFWPLIDS